MLGANVIIEKGAVVRDSIVMQGTTVKEGTIIDKSIIAENVQIGANCHLGVGEYADSTYNAKVYASDLVTIGEGSVIPSGVSIGKNTAISGVTTAEDYPDNALASGGAIIKTGGNA